MLPSACGCTLGMDTGRMRMHHASTDLQSSVSRTKRSVMPQGCLCEPDEEVGRSAKPL